jgi:hypothetical protein
MYIRLHVVKKTHVDEAAFAGIFNGNRTSLGMLHREHAGQTTIAGESVFGHRLSSTGFTPPANRLCLVLGQEATEMRSVDLPPLGGSVAGRRRLIPHRANGSAWGTTLNEAISMITRVAGATPQ